VQLDPYDRIPQPVAMEAKEMVLLWNDSWNPHLTLLEVLLVVMFRFPVFLQGFGD
jgi:hypothetical protein